MVTLTPPATALTAGLEVDFLPVAANTTTSPTLNVNSLGAVAITKSGGALAANDLTHTTIAKVIYDGANWELQNPQTSTASAIASGTANQIAYYATTGTVLSGTNTLPSGTLAITQTAGDTTTDVATDAFAQNAATTAQSAAITAAETYANTEYIQALSGDLSGTLPGPVTVVGINGSPSAPPPARPAARYWNITARTGLPRPPSPASAYRGRRSPRLPRTCRSPWGPIDIVYMGDPGQPGNIGLDVYRRGRYRRLDNTDLLLH